MTRRWIDDQSPFIYRVSYAVAWLLFHVWIRRFRAVGREHVPRAGGGFIVANHTSMFDPIVVGYAIPHRMLRGPGKTEIWTNALISRFMRKLGIFPLQQGIADAAAVRTMVALYRRGDMTIVYPEGTRSRSGELMPFNPDFTRLVMKLKAPIIPAGIAGARDVLPYDGRMLRHDRPVAVVFGEPLDLHRLFGDPREREVVLEATSFLESCIAEMVRRAECQRQELTRR